MLLRFGAPVWSTMALMPVLLLQVPEVKKEDWSPGGTEGRREARMAAVRWAGPMRGCRVAGPMAQILGTSCIASSKKIQL